MENDICFYLPSFYAGFHRNQLLLELMQKRPHYFYENIKIAAVYGCFPGSIWNGGRLELGSCERKEMEFALREWNQRGIACRFTFTNPLLEEKHLYDTFCNLCMELGNNGQNEVLVNSPLLEEYIRSHYPGYKIISSVTKLLDTEEQETRETKHGYELVVLNKKWNNTPTLFALPRKDKYEILVNSYCQDDCPNMRAHYEAIGRAQLNFTNVDFPPCKYINRNFYDIMGNKAFVTAEDLYGIYVDAGFRHFKLEGRTLDKYRIVESYLYYLVKPEHRDSARLSLLKAMEKRKK